jgi:two-component system CheB/CheR fusion protein
VALSVGYSEDDRWHLRGDGTRAWFGGMLCAVRDTEGRCMGFVKVMRDRTDLRATLDTLENRNASLRQALHEKDQHLITLAHELANPLSPLLQACHLLERADDTQRQRLLEVIRRQLDTLRRLVGDLRSEIGQQQKSRELVLQRFIVQDLLRQTFQSCEASAREHGLQLELLVPEAAIWIEADPARLHQVVLNLLSNAIKYTPAGGRVWLKSTVEDNNVVVRVEDTGVGVAPEMLPRIFELFTQEGASRHLSDGGMGVGLAVVKEWVDLHGGTVEVRSEGRGQGADFTVRLPLHQPLPGQ